jgi:hypothetical protein
MIESLIRQSSSLIREQLAQLKAPCVLSSFGKDSMVTLWLVREQKPDIDVLYFDAFPSPTKHRFALDIIQRWGLTVRSPLARGRDAITKGDHLELAELHELAPDQFTYFPIEAEAGYVPDENCLCGLEKLTDEVAPKCEFNFDAAFMGTRGDDVDFAWGDCNPGDAVISRGDNFRLVYPLKDWTEKDIWEASFLLGIPQNEARYFGNDMTANNDYYPLCTKCLGSDSEVICPQTNLPLPGMRSILKLDDRREAWRKTFVNIEQ